MKIQRQKSDLHRYTGKTDLFRSFFPHVLEVAQPNCTRKDSAADGTLRTLSRIDRAIINLSMAEALDFHSHVSGNLGERSIPSDHVAVRDQAKRIPSWMSKHPVFCSTLQRITEDHQYPDDPFAALADFKVILEKARKETHRKLLRNTPGRLGAKHLTFSTALRAYKNRHLGTLMHCCAAWEPVGKCFDQCSVACIDFHGLSQIIVNLTRERIAEREAEIRKKTTPWRNADPVFVLGAPRNRCSAFTQLPKKTVTPQRMKTNLARGYAPVGVRFLRHVPRANGTIAT